MSTLNYSEPGLRTAALTLVSGFLLPREQQIFKIVFSSAAPGHYGADTLLATSKDPL